MAEEGPRRSQGARYDLLLALWRLLTSVRFAVILIAFLVATGLLGVFLPQVPPPMRDNPQAVGGWLELQRGRFGPATEPLYRLGLFSVFDTLWFKAGLAVLVVAVGVCAGSRFPPTWRAALRPPRRVPRSYFEGAHHRASFATPPEPAALVRALRRHRYKVEASQEGDITHLFAERLPWASLGTFASHLSLILFIVGGLVSALTSYRSFLFVAEGASAPVFQKAQHPRQMQVYVEDAVGRFDPAGRPLDYRTEMVIYQGGREVKRGSSTVNGPLSYGGYRFHQAAYYGYGAALQVRDLATGNVVFKEVLALDDTVPGPRLTVSDEGGQTLLDETLVPTDFIATALGTLVTIDTAATSGPPRHSGRRGALAQGPGAGFDTSASQVARATQRRFWVGVKPTASKKGWEMVIFELGPGPEALRLVLAQGQEALAGGLRFRWAGLAPLPSSLLRDLPRPSEQGQGGPALLIMSNAVYGAVEASAGRAVAAPSRRGPPTLHIAGLGPHPLALAPAQAATVQGYEYTFLGQREFAGIEVRRDRGSAFIWIAAGLLILGLAATFYLPRRRLWALITPQRTYLAGIAPYMVNFPREMRRLGAEAGSPDALEGEEEE